MQLLEVPDRILPIVLAPVVGNCMATRHDRSLRQTLSYSSAHGFSSTHCPLLWPPVSVRPIYPSAAYRFDHLSSSQMRLLWSVNRENWTPFLEPKFYQPEPVASLCKWLLSKELLLGYSQHIPIFPKTIATSRTCCYLHVEEFIKRENFYNIFTVYIQLFTYIHNYISSVIMRGVTGIHLFTNSIFSVFMIYSFLVVLLVLGLSSDFCFFNIFN